MPRVLPDQLTTLPHQWKKSLSNGGLSSRSLGIIRSDMPTKPGKMFSLESHLRPAYYANFVADVFLLAPVPDNACGECPGLGQNPLAL